MKKIIKIFLIIFIIIIVSAGIFIFAQWDNLMALKLGMLTSQEDLQTMIDNNKQLISNALKEYPETKVRDLDEHEQEALKNGEITSEDAIKLVLGEKLFEKDTKKVVDKDDNTEDLNKTNIENKSNVESAGKKDNEKLTKQSVDNKVSELVAQMYVLKAQFSSDLEGIRNSIISEFDALPTEQKTNAKKAEVINRGISRASSLENMCDGNVGAIISELRTVLQENARDTSLADSIEKAYKNEKQLAKSYYVNLYLNS